MIDLAQATKEGNFSLKIIAFMMMLSMPGTLFTALFALPYIGVDMHQMWVYCAFI
jgi:hypothetical protein